MYEEREKGEKKKRSLVPLPFTNTHAHPPYLLNSPSIYIFIYNLESRIVLCALYRCLPASVTTSSILHSSRLAEIPFDFPAAFLLLPRLSSSVLALCNALSTIERTQAAHTHTHTQRTQFRIINEAGIPIPKIDALKFSFSSH